MTCPSRLVDVDAATFLAPDGQPKGYIEYVPGEFAWRGVDGLPAACAEIRQWRRQP
jgi:hypothetical protein